MPSGRACLRSRQRTRYVQDIATCGVPVQITQHVLRVQENAHRHPVYGAATTLRDWVFIKYSGPGSVEFSEQLTVNVNAKTPTELAAEFRKLAVRLVLLTQLAAKEARPMVCVCERVRVRATMCAMCDA